MWSTILNGKQVCVKMFPVSKRDACSWALAAVSCTVFQVFSRGLQHKGKCSLLLERTSLWLGHSSGFLPAMAWGLGTHQLHKETDTAQACGSLVSPSTRKQQQQLGISANNKVTNSASLQTAAL